MSDESTQCLDQTNSTVYSEKTGRENSYLTDDLSPVLVNNDSQEMVSSSFLELESEDEEEETDSKIDEEDVEGISLDKAGDSIHDSESLSDDEEGVDEEEEEDSFIVSDSDSGESSRDVTYVSMDNSIQILNSPSPPSRKQPFRLAKMDLNTPMRNVPCMTSTPANTHKNKPEPTTSVRRKLTVLEKKVDDPEMRAMFLELYPELAEQFVEDEQKESPPPVFSISEDSVICISDSEEEKKEDEKREPDCLNKEADSLNENSTLGSDDSFENYLKVLKGEDKKKAKVSSESDEEPPVMDDFIVSDDESIYESDEDEEEDELSDEEEDQENVPIPRKDSSSKKTNVDDYFLASLSADFKGKRHPDAVKYVEKGIKNKKTRENLTSTLFEIYKRRCFDGEISMEREQVQWTGRLRTTAGQCRNNIMKGTSSIELSIKVCSTPERLRDTLIHEMCHAATWLIDNQMKAKHGPFWKRWTRRCRQRCPSLPSIERCHAYKIDKKFIYECEGCSQKIGRDTKSFDTEGKICGICRGRFILKNNKPDTERKVNKFAEFVKTHYGTYKRNGLKHQEVMSILSAKWKEETGKVKEQKKDVKQLELNLSVLSLHN